MKKTIVALLLLSLYAPQIFAAGPNCVTTGNYPASMSYEMFDKAISFQSQKDYVALQKLLDAGLVIVLKKGVRVYLEETKLFSGAAKIRAPGMTEGLWTNMEAVDCK